MLRGKSPVMCGNLIRAVDRFRDTPVNEIAQFGIRSR